MSKTAEGPWGAHSNLVIDHSPEGMGKVIAEVFLHGHDMATMRRRTSLAAAAPELLEALEECYGFAALFNHDTDASWEPAKRRILSVIAKAKGERS